MRTRVLLKVAALAGILALTGCAAKVAQRLLFHLDDSIQGPNT
ncbi:hypothetical protein ACLBP1_27335, partial [Klebsiella pneumoniae]